MVSPVTILTRFLEAVFLMDSRIFSRVAISRPSSMIRARDRYSGLAPDTTRSFTVPLTHRVPMSPPGKKIGSTV